MGGRKIIVGKGKTNNKVHKGQYGSLQIDVPTLPSEMLLKVFKNGELVYQNHADKSLVERLTKRYNPKKKYSPKAIQIFRNGKNALGMEKPSFSRVDVFLFFFF